ncbi:MAG: O-antigen ligase family protein, partial [Candidatus Omnitrophica bacterium]|nr:O-antigen ligase family protein [Candidatus Omnitrophota bacterium]
MSLNVAVFKRCLELIFVLSCLLLAGDSAVSQAILYGLCAFTLSAFFLNAAKETFNGRSVYRMKNLGHVLLFPYYMLIMLCCVQALLSVMPEFLGRLGSVSAFMTIRTAGILVISALLTAVMAHFFTDLKYLISFVKLMLVLIFFVTVIGILHRVTGDTRLLWFFEMNQGNSFFGTFPYENTYGAYGILLLPFANAAASIQMRESFAVTDRTFGSRLMQLLESPFLFYLILQILLIVGIFISSSRFGSIILVSFLLVELIRSLIVSNWINTCFYSFIFSASGFFLFKSSIWQQFKGYSGDALLNGLTGRMDIAKGALSAFWDRPWLGWGIDGFKVISQQYVSANASYSVFKHANNEYVEFLCEAGLTGCAVLGVSVILTLIVLVSGRNKVAGYAKDLVGAAMASMILMAVSILGDSHLRVPACSLMFGVCIAVVISQTPYMNSELFTKVDRNPHARKLLQSLLAAICFFLFGIWSMQLVKAEVMKYSAKKIVIAPMKWIEFYSKYDADYWELRSRIEYKIYEFEDKLGQPDSSSKLLEHSLNSTQKAVALFPRNAFLHYRYAQLLLEKEEYIEAIEALEQGVKVGPYNN